MQARLKKDRHGWEAFSEIDLNPSQKLAFRTYKRHNKRLACTAEVWTRCASGMYSHKMSICLGIPSPSADADYSETVLEIPATRVTKKMVIDLHTDAMQHADDFKARALKFYADKAAKADAA